jgi:hypothetical protein
MRGTCSPSGEDEKCIQKFGWKSLWEYSETLILHTQILCFMQFYTIFLWSQPSAHKNSVKFKLILCFHNFMFSSNFYFSFFLSWLQKFTWYCVLYFTSQNFLSEATDFPVSSWEWLCLIPQCILSIGWCMAAFKEHILCLCTISFH